MKTRWWTLVCTVLGVWALARAGARAVDGALLEGSSSLHALAGPFQGTGERELLVNGALLHVQSGHAQGTLAAWRATARAECDAGASWALPLPPSAPERALTVEAQGDDSALVACLVGLRVEQSGPALLPQLRDLLADLDLTRFGELRVQRAHRSDEGLHVVRVRSAGPLPLRRMFPREGDAPGIDLPRVPRPLNARRVLSAYARGAAPALLVYARSGAAAALFAEHAGRLEQAAFTSVGGAGERGGAFQRGDEHVLMTTRAHGSQALLVVMALGLGPLSVEVAPALVDSAQPRGSSADNGAR